jgi:hypothetical protein
MYFSNGNDKISGYGLMQVMIRAGKVMREEHTSQYFTELNMDSKDYITLRRFYEIIDP